MLLLALPTNINLANNALPAHLPVPNALTLKHALLALENWFSYKENVLNPALLELSPILVNNANFVTRLVPLALELILINVEDVKKDIY